MSWHILTIDSPQATLTCRHRQLVYRPEKGEEQSLPLEDIAAIIITGFSVHLHHSLLIQAARMGVSLIICEKFLPVSLLLPADRATDTLLVRATEKLNKRTQQRLWQRTINAKTRNQFLLASHLAPQHPKLQKLQKAAQPQNNPQAQETRAARYFWQIFGGALGQGDFKRQRHGKSMNPLLNYGYTILLSITLQKLFALGLDPSFGISHSTREHATPLAYDLMEPFRPCVDWKIATWIKESTHNYEAENPITPPFRQYLGSTSQAPTSHQKTTLYFQNCIEKSLRSFRQAVLSSNASLYQAWTPSNSKWAGCW